MARQRRGGFRPPELRGTLGTLLRTALAQTGGLRSALERGAREGRARLDDVLASRRRTDVLAELGEVVLDLIRRGEIELDQLPEARELVEHLDAMDEERPPEEDEDDGAGAGGGGGGRDRGRFVAAPAPSRTRFDDRGTRGDGRNGAPDRAPARDGRARDGRDRDDGTVSSSKWIAPKRTAAPARVWRPPVDHARAEAEPDAGADVDVDVDVAHVRSPRPDRGPAPAAKKGGISFGRDDQDDDADLADYMHPDDVPPKDK